jgi:hypothetical protein
MTLAEPPKKKLLEQVREAIRLKHYSDRTEETYVQWIKLRSKPSPILDGRHRLTD